MNTNDKVKSSIFSIAKSDHQYDFLSLLQNMVYTYEPDSNINKAGNNFFSNTRQSLKENSVPIFQLNNREDYDYVVNDILKFDHEHGLSKNNKDLFESIYSKFSNRDYIKELFLDGIKDNFGMDNIQEGGLFWLEETENGLDAIFAHIDDISNLNDSERNNFLEKITRNKKSRSKEFSEEQAESPLLNFEGKQFSKNDIQKMSPEELSSLTALVIEENNRIYDLKDDKLIIKFYKGKLELFIPEINNKIKEFYPKYKALYFFTLLKPKGVYFNDLIDRKNLEDLTKLYKNYKKSNKQTSTQTMTKMVSKSNSVSSVRAKTNTSLETHIESFNKDFNLAHHILKEISFTSEENFLNIPIDRDKIANLYLIRKALNGKFNLDDYKVK